MREISYRKMDERVLKSVKELRKNKTYVEKLNKVIENLIVNIIIRKFGYLLFATQLRQES